MLQSSTTRWDKTTTQTFVSFSNIKKHRESPRTTSKHHSGIPERDCQNVFSSLQGPPCCHTIFESLCPRTPPQRTAALIRKAWTESCIVQIFATENPVCRSFGTSLYLREINPLNRNLLGLSTPHVLYSVDWVCSNIFRRHRRTRRDELTASQDM